MRGANEVLFGHGKSRGAIEVRPEQRHAVLLRGSRARAEANALGEHGERFVLRLGGLSVDAEHDGEQPRELRVSSGIVEGDESLIVVVPLARFYPDSGWFSTPLGRAA